VQLLSLKRERVIESLLGFGFSGEVFKATTGGETFALKRYLDPVRGYDDFADEMMFFHAMKVRTLHSELLSPNLPSAERFQGLFRESR
jgi:hypothetical protein